MAFAYRVAILKLYASISATDAKPRNVGRKLKKKDATMILNISSLNKLTIMKKLLFIAFLTLFCISCEKDEFDINNPDVQKFVQQIKKGTYNCYEKGENGENLWLIMPKFTNNHIQSLIDFSNDTSHIASFPLNPISSRTPFPYGRDYLILGECLLWTVEGIRNGYGYGSLDPYLIDTTLDESDKFKGLKGDEILIVRDIYKDWWYRFKNEDWKTINPLENSSYVWF